MMIMIKPGLMPDSEAHPELNGKPLRVRDPYNPTRLVAAGEMVSDTDIHWHRLLASGDVVKTTPEEVAADAAAAAKAKAAALAEVAVVAAAPASPPSPPAPPAAALAASVKSAE